MLWMYLARCKMQDSRELTARGSPTPTLDKLLQDNERRSVTSSGRLIDTRVIALAALWRPVLWPVGHVTLPWTRRVYQQRGTFRHAQCRTNVPAWCLCMLPRIQRTVTQG